MNEDIKRKLRKARRTLIYVLVCLWVLWPISIMVLESFRIDLSPLLAGKGVGWVGGVPFFSGGFRPSTINYFNAFAFDAFPILVFNTVIIALSSVLTSLLIGTPAAFTLARHHFRGKGLFEFLILILSYMQGLDLLRLLGCLKSLLPRKLLTKLGRFLPI